MSKSDLSGLKQMIKDFEKLDYEMEKFLREFLLEIGNRVLERTKKRTPVITGELRRNWKMIGPYRLSESMEVMFMNDKEYAPYVELGHRIMHGDTQVGFVEGYFMATISVEEIQRQIPKRFDRAWSEFCAQMLRGN